MDNLEVVTTCKRCLMDTTAANIEFDEHGVCNFCRAFESNVKNVVFKSDEDKKSDLDLLINKIKDTGKGKKYDCIVGVSGGVDSSWVLVKAIEMGLRPLAVHMDNGWNSELAQNNISNLVDTLGVELYTHVIDWNEYRELMQGFFDGDVIDVELLYDNAMLAVNYQLAAKFGIKYILSGHNQATEGMTIPENWNWFKFDKKNIVDIAKKNRNMKLSTFPAIGTFEYIKFRLVNNIKWTSFLDLMPYNKFEVLEHLQKHYNYKPYPYKHYESIFTRFYQGYILPKKFNVDKRKVHLSTLIMSKQMTKEDALKQLAEIPYPSEQALKDDIDYFKKKMNWSDQQLEDYINRPERPHTDFKSEKTLWKKLGNIYKAITGNTSI